MQPSPSPQAEPHRRTPPILRAILAGDNIDRWPIHVAPGNDELAAVWLARTARTYGLTTRQVLTELGYRRLPDTAAALRHTLGRRPDPLITTLALGPEDLQRLLAPAPIEQARLDYFALYRKPVPERESGSRFCPDCLTEDPWAWPATWTSPLVFACTRHRVLLARTCPLCKRMPWSEDGSYAHEGSFDRCMERPRTGRGHKAACKGRLTAAPTVPATDEDVTAQLRLLELAAAPDMLRTAVGIPATGRQVLDAVLELTFTALDHPADLADLNAPPAWIARAAAHAFRVLDAASPAEAVAADEVAFHPAGGIVPLGPARWLDLRPRNPLLGAIQLAARAGQLAFTDQLTFRTIVAPGRYPNNRPSARLRLPKDQPGLADLSIGAIPANLWPGTIPSALDGATEPAALAALLLAKTGRPDTFDQLGFELALPRTTHRRLRKEIEGITADITRTRRLLLELEMLYRHLQAAPPPIDYQVRRIIGDDTVFLTAALTSAGVADDQLEPVLRRFWERFTGGDIAHAPQIIQLPRGSTGELAHTADRARIDLAHAGHFATAFAAITNGAALRVRGPLEWRPP